MEATEVKASTNLFGQVTQRVMESIIKISAISDGVSLPRLAELSQASEDDVQASLKTLIRNGLIGQRNTGDKLRYFATAKGNQVPGEDILGQVSEASTFVCPVEGCGRSFDKKHGLEVHLAKGHLKDKKPAKDPPAEDPQAREKLKLKPLPSFVIEIGALERLTVVSSELEYWIEELFAHGVKRLVITKEA